MGEPNNVLKVYMKRPDRIRSVLEYFLGGKLPQDWVIESADGFYTRINSKGKISFRERDNINRIRAKEFSLWLGLLGVYSRPGRWGGNSRYVQGISGN